MKRPFAIVILMLALSATAQLFASAPALAQAGFDRPGGDYAHAIVRKGDPAVCAARCERDNRCRAWSFSYPTTASKDAMCWLKNTVTPTRADACCVSGVRGAALLEPRSDTLEFAIDRYGGDYKTIDVPSDPTGNSCATACKDDNKCRAFTYLRPGYGNNATGRCFLKDRVTKPRRKPCCISGVVR